jgi:hypothetical protein
MTVGCTGLIFTPISLPLFSIYHQLPTWARARARAYLEAALYLQAAILDKGYYDFRLLCPVGQDLGGFEDFKDGGRFSGVQGFEGPFITSAFTRVTD